MRDHADIPDQLTAALGDRYRIERELGRGGMATVHLAHDLKHDRQVAIKVLHPELAAVLGAERFLAEVRVTARLDHPHILTLIDSGVVSVPDARRATHDARLLYYVLPYVRGESLRKLLERERQLPLARALAITRQVAGALDHAHRHGVIHRDIKPENILLHEGEAMLVDFGIALGLTEAGGSRLTETGMALGTPQYMSPEQATGQRSLDQRSDIYSLAAVTYEMIAGEPPMRGATPQATIAKLMTETPVHLRVIRPDVPAAVDAAVARGLAKVPADRFESATEFVEAMSDARTAGRRDGAAPAPSRPHALTPSRRWGLWGALALFGAALVAVWALQRPQPTPTLAFGRSQQLTSDPGLEIQPALSPDGKLVAYAAGRSSAMRIFIRPVGGGRTIPLSDDSTAVEFQPRWSPDGEQLLFLSRGGVSIAPALGGSSRRIVPRAEGEPVRGAAWSPDGREIAFARADSLFAVPAQGGQARTIGTGSTMHSCAWSPDGAWIACVENNSFSIEPGSTFANLAPSGLLLFPAGGGEPRRLVDATELVASPAWLGDSHHMLFISNRDGPRDIYRLRLSADGRPRGDPVRVTTGLGANSISLSADGRRIAYAVHTAQANIWSIAIPVRPPTTVDGAVALTRGSQVIEAVRLAPDGRSLIYDSNIEGNADIYRLPLAGGSPEQLTADPIDEFAGDLSPDGRMLAYHTWRNGTRDIEVKPLDGGPVVAVTNTPGQESAPRWSPDGQRIAYNEQVQPSSLHIVQRTATGWSAPVNLGRSTYNFAWSSDGREIAIVTGANPVSSGGIAVVATADGVVREVADSASMEEAAESVEWNPDGSAILFKSRDARGRAGFWSVPAQGGIPSLLIRLTDPERQSNRREFATDGTRIYFTMDDRQSDVFVAELEERP